MGYDGFAPSVGCGCVRISFIISRPLKVYMLPGGMVHDGLCWLGNPPVSTLELLLEEPVHRIVRQTDAPRGFLVVIRFQDLSV